MQCARVLASVCTQSATVLPAKTSTYLQGRDENSISGQMSFDQAKLCVCSLKVPAAAFSKLVTACKLQLEQPCSPLPVLHIPSCSCNSAVCLQQLALQAKEFLHHRRSHPHALLVALGHRRRHSQPSAPGRGGQQLDVGQNLSESSAADSCAAAAPGHPAAGVPAGSMTPSPRADPLCRLVTTSNQQPVSCKSPRTRDGLRAGLAIFAGRSAVSCYFGTKADEVIQRFLPYRAFSRKAAYKSNTGCSNRSFVILQHMKVMRMTYILLA